MKMPYLKHILAMMLTVVMCACSSDGPMNFPTAANTEAPEIRIAVGEFSDLSTRSETVGGVDCDAVKSVWIGIYDNLGNPLYRRSVAVREATADGVGTYVATLSVTPQLRAMSEGHIYLIANRPGLLTDDATGSEENLMTILDEPSESESNTLAMWASKPLSDYTQIGARADGTQEVYNLKRNKALLEMKATEVTDKEDNPHSITGFTLACTRLNGTLIPSAESVAPNDDSGVYPLCGSQLPLLVFPSINQHNLLTTADDDADPSAMRRPHRGVAGLKEPSKAICLIFEADGLYYKSEVTDGDGAFLDINPNHRYSIEPKGINGNGYRTISDAIVGYANAEAALYDEQPMIFSMVTDGNRILGVSDTIRYRAGEASYELKVKIFSKDAEELDSKEISLEKSDDSDWLSTGGVKNWDYVNEQGNLGKLFTYPVTITAPTDGSSREGYVDVKWQGLLCRVPVIIDRDFKTDIFTTSLTVSGGADAGKYEDYYIHFLPQVKGTQASANSGRTRSEGFHFPIGLRTSHSQDAGYVDYSYTCTLREGTVTKVEFADNSEAKWFEKKITLEKSSAGFTLTWSGSGMDSEYHSAPEGLRVTVGNSVYTFDLYHTGFFCRQELNAYDRSGATADGWYYYEVASVTNRDGTRRLWLDRNIGASGSGKGDAGGLMTAIGSAGTANYRMVEEVCPPGFRVPSVNEWNEMTLSSQYGNAYVTEAAGSYWDPRVAASEGKTVHFPASRYWDANGGKYAGDNNIGYYWTSTTSMGVAGAGQEAGRWFQVVKFEGSNRSYARARITASADNNAPPTSSATLGMTLRCVDNAQEKSVADRLNFSVQGYTHIYLYLKDNTGSRISLTGWPGERICPTLTEAAAKEHHDFTFESTINLDDFDKFYVILLNIGPNGEILSYWNGSTHSGGTVTSTTAGYAETNLHDNTVYYKYPEGITSKYQDYEPVTIYFDMNGLNWTSPMVHYWSDNASTTFPGLAMSKLETDIFTGIYKMEISGWATGLLFSNSSNTTSKTDDFTVIANHVYTFSGDSGRTLEEYALPMTVYFMTTDNCNWNAPYIYGWCSYQSGDIGEWPGKEMTYVGAYGTNRLYKYQIPHWITNLIFSNNGASQTYASGFTARPDGIYYANGDCGFTIDVFNRSSFTTSAFLGSDEYYLIGDVSNWGWNGTYKFTHNPEKGRYELKNIPYNRAGSFQIHSYGGSDGWSGAYKLAEKDLTVTSLPFGQTIYRVDGSGWYDRDGNRQDYCLYDNMTWSASVGILVNIYIYPQDGANTYSLVVERAN